MHFHWLFFSTLLMLLSLSPITVIAGDCKGCPASCGSITNNAGKTLRYTTDPNPDLTKQTGRCKFWNWYSSNSITSIIPSPQTVSCSQIDLASGSGKKGGCKQKLDVDGFSFPFDNYWVGLRWVRKGEWTKFPNPVDFTCKRVPVVRIIRCTWTL